MIFCYQQEEKCASIGPNGQYKCTKPPSLLQQYWFGLGGTESTDCNTPLDIMGSRTIDVRSSEASGLLLAAEPFPTSTTPLGTGANVQNCVFHPNQHSSKETPINATKAAPGAIIGYWSCSPGSKFDHTTAIMMGYCYKDYDASVTALKDPTTSREYWSLFRCRAENHNWPSDR